VYFGISVAPMPIPAERDAKRKAALLVEPRRNHASFDGTIAHDQRQRRAQHHKPAGGHFLAAERHGEFS